jgi:hypothetical protein
LKIKKNGVNYYLIIIQAFTSESIPDQIKTMINCNSPSALEKLIPIIVAGQQAGQIVKDDPQKLGVSYFALIQGIAIRQVQNTELSIDADLILRMFKA